MAHFETRNNSEALNSTSLRPAMFGISSLSFLPLSLSPLYTDFPPTSSHTCEKQTSMAILLPAALRCCERYSGSPDRLVAPIRREAM